LSRAERYLLFACKKYVDYGDGDMLVEVLFKQAQLYYWHNRFDRAEPLYTKIALEHPEHPLAESAVELALDSLKLSSDWQQVSLRARSFNQSERLLAAHPNLRSRLGLYDEAWVAKPHQRSSCAESNSNKPTRLN